MDNKKIGKLIADLRREKGLTQQELGDKVGVGFRAVSKWERGLTLPDITIINELSNILGISSDELLSGEIKKENKNKSKRKISSKLKITMLIIFLLITILSSITAHFNNKTYTYNIESTNEEYYIEGQITLNKNDIIVNINKLNFLDETFLTTEIENYEYKIKANNKLIVGYGYKPNGDLIEKQRNIINFTDEFRVNYTGETNLTRKELENNELIITIIFTKTNNEEIIKEVKCSLSPLENNK